jgi:hypothetical protein
MPSLSLREPEKSTNTFFCFDIFRNELLIIKILGKFEHGGILPE